MEDEKPTGEETKEAPAPKPPPQWERRTSFKINDRMKVIVEKTIDVAKDEVVRLRRKLEKLQYGG